MTMWSNLPASGCCWVLLRGFLLNEKWDLEPTCSVHSSTQEDGGCRA